MTELRSEAKQLEVSEERLQLALWAGGGIGTWDWDIQSNLVVADRGFADFYGVEPQQAARGLPVAEFFQGIHADDLGDVEALIAEAIKNRTPFSADYRVQSRNGQLRWVHAQGRCIYSDTGEPLRLPGAAFDITRRKRADARRDALTRLTDELRGLDDPTEIAFAASKILGETLQVSRVGYGLVSRETETITIERDWNAPGIKTLAGVLNFRDYGSYIEQLKRGEAAIVANAAQDPRTKDTVDALASVSALSFINMPVSEQGGLVALLYLNHALPREWPADDLALVEEIAERTRTATERARVSAALREANETLEAKVRERTSELMLAEESLRQSQKMEAVGQLTGGLAHDFNNLLTGITGSLEMMQTRIAQGRHADLGRYMDMAQGAAKRAASLTQRLLAFSRRQTLDPKPTDVNRLIGGMEELVQRTMGPAVRVEFVGASSLWPTRVDPPQLENALLNLCINARDAMPDGGRLTVETANRWMDPVTAAKQELPVGQYVSLCVTDTGTGMPPDVLARAFDPFFTTKPLGEGTGLGLSMIYGFARQSGGQVRIYSEVGVGTTVCLYLPRDLKNLEQDAAATEPEADDLSGSGRVVLVVDDEPTIRLLITEMLHDDGFVTLEASDGQSAMRLLESPSRIDLLISDVGLPGGMNGRQVADAARVLRPNLKVLFVTGYAENAVVGNGNLEPGMHVLTKPFAMTTLERRIHEIVDGAA